MSQYPQLPDIDRLEALARAATCGPWHVTKYCSVMDEEMETLVVSSDSSREDKAFIAAANPAAVLALIALARRAQPEVEAPQAEKQLYTCKGKGGQYEIIGGAVGAGLSRQVGSMMVYRDISDGGLYYRTLSDFDARMEALPAAQQAESGALASRSAEVDDEGLPALPHPASQEFFVSGTVDYFTAEQYRQGQRDAVAADRARRGDGWISVEERLPEVGMLVMVYSPPTQHDWPDALRIDFDYLDPDADEPRWFNHGEHYEHFCCVAKPEGSVGPSEEAPYTHWRPVLAAPSHTTNKENG